MSLDPNNPIVPWLRAGKGASPSDGGCVMQIVDWLSTEGWSDKPSCVHPVLRDLAIGANDALPAAQRQVLVDLIPRLMNTNVGGIHYQLTLAAAKFILPLFQGTVQEARVNALVYAAEMGEKRIWRAVIDEGAALLVLAVLVEEGTDEDVVEPVSVLVSRRNKINSLTLLLHVLDEFDRLVPREFPKLDYTAVCALDPAVVGVGK